MVREAECLLKPRPLVFISRHKPIMVQRFRFEGFAIISADGMIANAAGIMPDSLKIEVDQIFFEKSLDRADLVIHGRYSREHHRRSDLRHRLVLTHAIASIQIDPDNKRSLFWNPNGASFEQAAAVIGIHKGIVSVIGGRQAFGLFLARFDAFFLSRVSEVLLPGGRPVFPTVPPQEPDEVLREHGLILSHRTTLDADKGLTLERWDRVPESKQ